MSHDLLFSYADPADPWVKRSLIRLIEKSTGQPALKRLYDRYRAAPDPDESFFTAVLRTLEVTVDVDPARLAAAPRSGPLVIVANHPFGVLDGIAIGWIAERIRPDFKVLTNAVLLRAPEARPYLLPVDFAPTAEATRTNLATRDAARRLLAEGGCVVVFPAGGISTAPDRFGRHPAVDAPWQPFVAQLIQRSRAAVLPVYFHGQNGRAFQIASHLHLILRLSLIFHEVRSRMGTKLDVVVGDPIPAEHLAGIPDRAALVARLRDITYDLADRLPPARPVRRRRRIGLGRPSTESARREPLRPST
jgi:putative hemolysin